MLLDFHYFVQKWPVFTLGLAFIIALKFLIILAICFLFRYPNKISVFTALALAQISEFGFLVLVAAKKYFGCAPLALGPNRANSPHSARNTHLRRTATYPSKRVRGGVRRLA